MMVTAEGCVTVMLVWIDSQIAAAAHIDNQTVSDKSGYARHHFQRVFRRITGEKLGAYIARRKLIYAADQLICTDKQVTDIALDIGFHQVSSFCRVFKNKYGYTPNRYRIIMRAIHATDEN